MTGQRFRVGIVGLEPGRSWAARAHIPALRALSESYEIAGVANRSRVSAEKAAAAAGLPRAFADVAELVAANSGLGYAIIKAQRFLQTDKIFCGIILIGLIGLAMDQCFRLMHRKAFPWLYARS